MNVYFLFLSFMTFYRESFIKKCSTRGNAELLNLFRRHKSLRLFLLWVGKSFMSSEIAFRSRCCGVYRSVIERV